VPGEQPVDPIEWAVRAECGEQADEGALAFALDAVVHAREFENFLRENGEAAAAENERGGGHRAQLAHVGEDFLREGARVVRLHVVDVAHRKADEVRAKLRGALRHGLRRAMHVPDAGRITGGAQRSIHVGQPERIDRIGLIVVIEVDEQYAACGCRLGG